MKRFLHIMVVIMALLPLSTSAQRNCGTMEYLEEQIKADPSILQKMQQIEQHTQQVVQNPAGVRQIITIPVVVHVVYKNGSQNISDAQVLSQIAILNEDFRKLNSDAIDFRDNIFGNIAADAEIEFCLASVDPDGNSTNGITRTPTNRPSFSYYNEAIKFTSSGGHDAWPRDQYLNIWVGNLSNGLLGYAQFPGGAASTDGVVVHYNAFGDIGTAQAPYNLGRTATHEVGHWLNLRHIWGDGGCGVDDFVNDTPIAGGPNYGCPSPNANSCAGGLPDMWENYMDYTYDQCMYAFTNGQKSRMQAILAPAGFRHSLLSSNGCGTSTTPTCAVPSGLSTSNVTSTSADLSWNSVSGALSYNLQYKESSSATWSSSISTTSTSYSLGSLIACTSYDFKVEAVCTSLNSGFSASSTFSTTGCSSGGGSCDVPSGLSSTPVNNKKTRLAWNAVSGAVGYTVEYREVGNANWTSTFSSNTQLMINTNNGTSYEWQVQTDCGGGNTSAFSPIATFTGGTASRQTAAEFSLNVYPNPAIDQLFVEFSGDKEVGSIVVIDMLGRVVYRVEDQELGTSNYVEVNLRDIQNGVYFIRLEGMNEILKVEKVIVNK